VRSPSGAAYRFDCLESRLTHEWTEVNYVSSLYNFGVNHLGITVSHSSSVILCLSVALGTCVNFIATVWLLCCGRFPQVLYFIVYANGTIGNFKRDKLMPQCITVDIF
jgi:hypothetical protein